MSTLLQSMLSPIDSGTQAAREASPVDTARCRHLALIKYIRPVFVSRSDQDSRRKTVEEIKRRAQSDGKWPQIMIFPEGTCTNRSCLITFKPGAFIPGVPVQPVVLRYPNKLAFSVDFLAQVLIQEICQAATWFSVHMFMSHCALTQQAQDDIGFGRAVLQAAQW
ncbi:Lysophosphatidylcholine acyltransferase 1 [Chelonia mydas]|uniref:Lysophosphatidylcholine acyltransferase 1 n=1 Tax=Chelonia mydas TaxID=8469 RepID=M7BZC5_CHEMY|nr:Lysophosphatidylcholine acyltransferase 1 [Chelonia mydas]